MNEVASIYTSQRRYVGVFQNTCNTRISQDAFPPVEEHGSEWWKRAKRKVQTHCTPNDEDSFLLAPCPLQNLIGALSQGIPARVRTGDAVEFEQWRHPCQRYRVAANAMMDFEMGIFGMRATM